jgi:hypothetical protein
MIPRLFRSSGALAQLLQQLCPCEPSFAHRFDVITKRFLSLSLISIRVGVAQLLLDVAQSASRALKACARVNDRTHERGKLRL